MYDESRETKFYPRENAIDPLQLLTYLDLLIICTDASRTQGMSALQFSQLISGSYAHDQSER